MDAVAEILVERELLIDAAPETVWELLVDPGQITQWMGTNAKLEARRGGEYRLAVIPGHTARGEVVEIDAPRRLVYTWGWEGNERVPPGSTVVEFDLQPRGDRTLLRFTHRELPTSESAASHAHGWDHYLPRLVQAARGENPGVDAWVTSQTIKNYFDALKQKGDWQSLLADDMTFSSFTSPVKSISGKRAYLQATERFYSSIITGELRELIVDGDKAVALTRYELQGPAGRFTSDVAEIFTVRDGRIATFGIYFDTAPFPK
jgi:uncharacterized protein YndB with AHSA1/START domain/ketosteroid isomerase-like protein